MFPRAEDLPGNHPCHASDIRRYYSAFLLPVLDALRTVPDIEIEPFHGSPGALILWLDRGKVARTWIDYADTPRVDVPARPGDAVFKMKYCHRQDASYAALRRDGVHVFPGGYILAPGVRNRRNSWGEARRHYLENMHSLRVIRDSRLFERELLTRGAFHALQRCPARLMFYSEDLFQGAKSTSAERYFLDVARSRAVLNLCGPENTIDRKVVEFCGIGSVILTSTGLSDLRLPGDRYFTEENVIWITEPGDIQDAMEALTEEDEVRLVDATRRLFDDVFAPEAMGAYYRLKAEEMLCRASV